MDEWLHTWMNIWLMLEFLPRSTVAAAAGVLGLFLGSFYGVCASRIPAGESILWPPSHCPHCARRLRPWELIPVLSWVMLRGRCAGCGRPIGWEAPATELLSGAIAAALGWTFGFSVELGVYVVFAGIFLVASLIDAKTRLLPDVLTLGGGLLALPAAVYGLGHTWTETLAGGLGAAGLFWLLRFYYLRIRHIEALGLGDVWLMLPIGFLSGILYTPIAVFLAALLALGAFAVVRSLRGSVTEFQMPFGPFLCAGAVLTWLAGMRILAFWLALVTGGAGF